MSPSNLLVHGGSLCLSSALIETALEAELGHILLLLDHGGDLKQAVGGADVAVSGRVSAADHDAVFGLLDHLEVVRHDCANFVGAGEEVGSIPQMTGGFGASVFPVKEGSLGDVT